MARRVRTLAIVWALAAGCGRLGYLPDPDVLPDGRRVGPDRADETALRDLATDEADQPDAAMDVPGDVAPDSMTIDVPMDVPDAPADVWVDVPGDVPADGLLPVMRECRSGGLCTCMTGQACIFTCPTADCDFVCQYGSTCQVSCGAAPEDLGICSVDCQATAQCQLQCPVERCSSVTGGQTLMCNLWRCVSG